MSRLSGRIGAAALAAAFTFAGCSAGTASDDDRVQVVAAFYPLVYAVQEVGGDLVAIDNLTPPGVEPHDLELSSSQVISLTDADLVLYLGRGFQPAVDDVVSGLDDDQLLDVLEGRDLAAAEEDEGLSFDPHVWLDPSNMAFIVDVVAERLSEIDPDNSETFAEKADTIGGRLADLDAAFADGLADCERHEIVTSHAAFGYLATRYGLEQVAVSGLDPEIEPSPARLAEVATYVEEHGVTTIFFEDLLPPDVAETIASETGAQTAELSPLESKPASGDYVDAMERNLSALTEALGCD